MLGNFEESVLREARGPAMLDYLDLRENQVGVPPGTGYNENFPRELLELHTMGVTGPYTESDVKEMARALTGWREEWNNEANFDPDYPGFRYQNSRHDYLGSKTILGQVDRFAGRRRSRRLHGDRPRRPPSEHGELRLHQAGAPLRARGTALRAGRALRRDVPRLRPTHPTSSSR